MKDGSAPAAAGPAPGVARLRGAADAVLTYAVLAAILVAVAVPFLFMVMTSLKTNLDILEVPPNWHIFNWETIKQNYTEVLRARNFLSYTRNSVVVVFGATLVAMALGTPAAPPDTATARICTRSPGSHQRHEPGQSSSTIKKDLLRLLNPSGISVPE